MERLRALRSGCLAWSADEVVRWLRVHELGDMEVRGGAGGQRETRPCVRSFVRSPLRARARV